MIQVRPKITRDTLEDRKSHRYRLELVQRRLHLLSKKDKALLTMYLENGTSIRQISRLLRCSQAILRKRIQRLISGLTDRNYIFCLRNRSKFTRMQQAIARDHFLLGISARQIAKKRNITYYRSYREIRQICRIINDSNETLS